ncbi:hypothetical protein CYMTET_21594 [Cymbomonas tetramitiformis]|uniref:Uncharacterized protein n=1 Tax=Cymbomonas tetramitiformis TaxID=36881 RepID=A0AAE0G1U1_9CHLO|nr:hypothetical protein CYMTET_21594 [Cymbomonas tetramitiformis]
MESVDFEAEIRMEAVAEIRDLAEEDMVAAAHMEELGGNDVATAPQIEDKMEEDMIAATHTEGLVEKTESHLPANQLSPPADLAATSVRSDALPRAIAGDVAGNFTALTRLPARRTFRGLWRRTVGPAVAGQFLSTQSSFPSNSLQGQQQHSQALPGSPLERLQSQQQPHVQQQRTHALVGSPLERPQGLQQQAPLQQQHLQARVGPSTGRSGVSLERTYSQQLPSRPPAAVHPRQQPQFVVHLARHTAGQPRRAQQQLLLQRGPKPMEHTHLEQELLQSEVAVGHR